MKKKKIISVVHLFLFGIFLNTTLFAIGPDEFNPSYVEQKFQVLSLSEAEIMNGALEKINAPTGKKIVALEKLRLAKKLELDGIEKKLRNFSKTAEKNKFLKENIFIVFDCVLSKMKVAHLKMKVAHLKREIFICNQLLEKLQKEQTEKQLVAIEKNAGKTIKKYKTS